MGEGDVELAHHANGGFDTNVVGGRGRGGDDEAPVWGMPMHNGGAGGMGMDDKDRIVKTVHINQFSEND